jgi:hypothetical protein
MTFTQRVDKSAYSQVGVCTCGYRVITGTLDQAWTLLTAHAATIHGNSTQARNAHRRQT